MNGPTAEEKKMGCEWKVDESYRTTLQDPLRPELLVGRRESQGGRWRKLGQEAYTGISDSPEQRQERLREATDKRIASILQSHMTSQLVKSANLFWMLKWTRNLTHMTFNLYINLA